MAKHGSNRTIVFKDRQSVPPWEEEVGYGWSMWTLAEMRRLAREYFSQPNHSRSITWPLYQVSTDTVCLRELYHMRLRSDGRAEFKVFSAWFGESKPIVVPLS